MCKINENYLIKSIDKLIIDVKSDYVTNKNTVIDKLHKIRDCGVSFFIRYAEKIKKVEELQNKVNRLNKRKAILKTSINKVPKKKYGIIYKESLLQAKIGNNKRLDRIEKTLMQLTRIVNKNDRNRGNVTECRDSDGSVNSRPTYTEKARENVGKGMARKYNTKKLIDNST